MTKRKLLELYRKAVKKIGFQENKKEEGWMPKLGPNNYRAIIRHGMYHGVPATITVSPLGVTSLGIKEMQRYQENQDRFPGILKIPAILAKGSTEDAEYFVQKKEDGQRTLGEYPSGTSYPFASRDEKMEVAQLYHSTAYYFNSHPILHALPQMSVQVFFSERMERYAENYAKKNVFLSDDEIEMIRSYLYDAASSLSMEQCFAHFSNTDIIKAGDRYFVCDATMAWRPEMYGAAFWIWGATTRAGQISSAEWLKEIREWIECFGNPEKLKANLAERMAGMLLVDMPLERAPFDTFSQDEIQKTADIAKAILKEVM